MPPRRRPFLAYLLLKDGLVTKAQLDEALRAQAEAKTSTPLERILLERNLISQARLNQVLDRYQKKHRLGAILVEMKLITDDQLRTALQHQEKTGQRLGDALVQLNLVTERQMRRALSKQFDVNFVDLDAADIDRDLASLIDRGYAQQHRVLPLARTDDRLTLAMDDPTDLETVEELASSTGSKIEVVTSTLAAFQRAFLKLYGDSPAPAAAPPGAPAEATRRAPTAESPKPRTEEDAGREDREQSMRALRELDARHAATARALAQLQTAHEALRAEREAEAPARQALEARYAEAERALGELRVAHEALQTERGKGVQALRDLEERHTRVLGALKAAQDALAQERGEGAPTRQALETRRAEAERALADLQTRHTESEKTLADLQAAHDALRKERETQARTFQDLASRTVAQLETAQEALRKERETSAQVRQELEALRRRFARP